MVHTWSIRTTLTAVGLILVCLAAAVGGLGLYAGSVIYGLLYDRVMPALARGSRPTTLARALDVEPWILVVLAVEIAVFGLYALERGRRRPTSSAARAGRT